jgi:flagellar motor switch protein FliN
MMTIEPQEIEQFSELPLTVEAELDHCQMTIREILDLNRGSVIKLTRSAGDNIDVVVGGAPIGFAEIVILEDLMGLRITDFHS